MKRWLAGLLARAKYSARFQRLSDKLRYPEREDVLRIAMEFAAWHELPGDYLEFGVAQGGTTTRAFHFARRVGLDGMRLFVFDSFEGLPEVAGVDADEGGKNEFHGGQYACSIEDYKANLRAAGVDLDRVIITPGWFDQ